MIRELIEAVERGELAEVNSVLGRMFAADNDLPWDWISNVNSAFRGSVDAALALMQAVLPGWTWGRDIGGKMWVAKDTWGALYDPDFSAYATTPARALLLAILKAKEGETP